MKSPKERIIAFFNFVTAPGAENSGRPRRGFIFRILIFSAIFLSLVAAITMMIDPDPTSEKISVGYRAVIDGLLFFTFLYFLSLSGKTNLAAAIFSLSYFLIAFFMALLWGSNVPLSLVFYALSIVTSSILVGSRFALSITILIVASFPAIFHIHNLGILESDTSWRVKETVPADLIIYAASLVVIFIVSYLYNVEIRRSLVLAEESEKALKREKDLLEDRVTERTAELKREHLNHIAQISRFVEFGKLSSGIFHDLANHLNAILLMMSDKMIKETAEISQARKYLEEFRKARGDFEKFVNSTKGRLREVSYAYFVPDDEISDLLDFFTRSAEKEKVNMVFLPGAGAGRLSGSPTKFSHIVTNLIANAIESYESLASDKYEKKQVTIKTYIEDKEFIMEVRDFGCGIGEDDKAKIFEPFHTTKGDKGTGLGLTLVKDTVENDFGGVISFESGLNVGTVFIVKIPIFDPHDKLS